LVLSTSYEKGSLLELVSPQNGEVLLSKNLDGILTTWVDWNPNGSTIATGSSSGITHIWDASSLNLLKSLGVHKKPGWSYVAWNPDGSSLLTAGHGQMPNIWNPESSVTPVESSKTLRNPRQLLGVEGEKFFFGIMARWSPDGTRIIAGDPENSTVKLWDALTGRMVADLGTAQGFSMGAFSPDGKSILTGSSRSGVRIWYSSIKDALPMWRAAAARRMNSD
jgi:WD40 repeat protein